jgi:HEAT repeat protein
LIQALKSDDANLRWRAARALGVIGSPSGASALADLAKDAEPLVRAQAVFALGRLKVADDASLKAIVGRLSDDDTQVRRAAVRALRMTEAPREAVRPLVVKLLNDAEPTIAMRALGALVEGGVEVVPALASALEEREARYWACLALGEIGPQAKDAVPNLIKVLGDDRPEERVQATVALAEIGPDAKPAAGELIKLLGDPFESVRVTAAFALGRLGDESASEALQKCEAATDPFLSMMATWALAKIHKSDQQRTAQAVERLVTALGDKNREMASMASRALADLEVDPA